MRVDRSLAKSLFPLVMWIISLAFPATAQVETDEEERRPWSEGPNAVESQIEEDGQKKKPWIGIDVLDPYEDLKQQINEKIGLSLGLDYSNQYFHATDSLVDDDVASGMVRLYGAWEVVGRDKSYPGRLVFKVEHRHRYLDQTPADLSFDVGNVGFLGPPFNDDEWRLTNLFWRQGFDNERYILQVGFLDVTDYVDIYGMASPWLHFANLAFSTGSSSIALPGDATLGFTTGAWVTDQIYLLGGMADINADPTDPFDGFESFVDDNEYFKHVEVGWTSGRGNQYLDNIHLTFWHADERDDPATNDGWGFNFSAAWWIAEAWLPFLRAGYAHDGGSLLEESVSVGIGHQPLSGRDVFGLAFNWGTPNSDSFGPGLDDQYAIELFYRIQLTQHLAVTPSVQWLGNPALNPEDDSIWLFGLRARLAL